MDILHIKEIFDDYYCLTKKHHDITEVSCGSVRGHVGLALCHSSFYLLFNEEKYLDEVRILLTKMLTRNVDNYSFGYGLAGLAWTVELLKQTDLLECNWNWTEIADKHLAKKCQEQILAKEFDYFSGCGGLLNYFLNKQEKGQIVYDLAESYVREISKEFMSVSNRQSFNLGVPHGLIGYILLLINLKISLNFQVDSLIDNILNLLWKSRNHRVKNSTLPYFSNETKDTVLAWCYGDLPFIYCLIKAKKYNIQLNNSIRMDSLVEQTLNRTDCFKNNNTLCHGSIVIAMLFFEIWKVTGNQKSLCVLEKWKSHSYEIWEKSYSDFKNKNLGAEYYRCPSLFNGPSGFFLSMLSMANVNIVKWEQCLII